MPPADTNRPEPRSKGRPSVEEAARIDRAILEAARRVLLEQGEAASLNAVAKQAGLSRKTVYARYESRENLFAAAVKMTLQEVQPIEYEPAADFRQRLENYIEAALTVLSGSAAQSFQKILATHSHTIADLRGEMVAASQRMFFAPLASLIQKAADTDEIETDDPQLAARMIFNATFGYFLVSALAPDPHLLSGTQGRRYAHLLARTFTAGLARQTLG